MSGITQQAGEQHPEEWRKDLNPDYQPESADNYRSAYDIKAMHNRFEAFNDDELRQIPVLKEGTRLEQGSTYIDLSHEAPEEFTARGDEEAGENHCYVPKSEVHYETWNRLIGVTNPERTGETTD